MENKLVKSLAICVGVAAMGATVSKAGAVPVQETATTSYNSGDGSNAVVTLNGSSIGTEAVPLTTTLVTGGVTTTLTTYCVDLKVDWTGATQAANVYSNYSSSVNDSSGYLRNMGRAGWLVDTYSAQFDAIADATTRNIDRAALQVAVWKAIYETNDSKLTSLTTGFVTFSGLGGGVASEASTLLQALYNNGNVLSEGATLIDYPQAIDPTYHLAGNANQDMIGASSLPSSTPSTVPVPEPSTAVMMTVAGLIFAGSRLRAGRRAAL